MGPRTKYPITVEQAESARERFEAKYQKTDGCWLWTAVTAHGYGQISINGRMRYATHVALALTGIVVPVGMLVRHKCDTPLCVNPDHLELGTVADNSRDMVIRGRSARGDRHGRAKLTEPMINAIFALSGCGYSQQMIADKFGVYQSLISRILSGKKWAHVKRDSTLRQEQVLPLREQEE